MKQTILGAICLSLAASIWGGMYVVSKYVLDFIPPLTLVWLRFIIAFVVLYVILKTTEKKQKKNVTIHKKDWLLFAWIGFVGYFISITCQFIRCSYRLLSDISYTCIYGYICSAHFKRETNCS
ncbi:hypothetical protein IKK_03111 [Bacillus mycoides]|nr:hypothetical protein IKK_03111 [Bacillus mycoides]